MTITHAGSAFVVKSEAELMRLLRALRTIDALRRAGHDPTRELRELVTRKVSS